MPEDLKPWIFIIIFVVLPFLQWVFRKFAERQVDAEKARREAAGGGAGTRTATDGGPQAARPPAEEEEPLPEWLDPEEWGAPEEIESAEEIAGRERDRAPPPRLDPLLEAPEVPARPSALPERTRPQPVRAAAEETRRSAFILTSPPAPTPASRPLASSPGGAAPARVRPGVLPGFPAAGAGAVADPRLPAGVEDLRRAVLWSEVLGRPRALRPHGTDDPAH